MVNHQAYCNVRNYKYIFDRKQRKTIKSKFDHKLHAILDLDVDDQWWFWIDDDAFFTNFEKKLEDINTYSNKIMVFAEGPVNLNEEFTYLSSGNFFFKNSTILKEFFQTVLDTDINKVKNWWDYDKLGVFTNGDQDRIIYQLFHNRPIFEKTKVVSYDVFNTRPYHFTTPTDHLLCHFSGGEKPVAIKSFQEKFNFSSPTLIDKKYEVIEKNTIKKILENMATDKRTIMFKKNLKEFLK